MITEVLLGESQVSQPLSLFSDINEEKQDRGDATLEYGRGNRMCSHASQRSGVFSSLSTVSIGTLLQNYDKIPNPTPQIFNT